VLFYSDELFGTPAPASAFEAQIVAAYITLIDKLDSVPDTRRLEYLARGVRDSCRYLILAPNDATRAMVRTLLADQIRNLALIFDAEVALQTQGEVERI
jgi:hypothetical protein